MLRYGLQVGRHPELIQLITKVKFLGLKLVNLAPMFCIRQRSTFHKPQLMHQAQSYSLKVLLRLPCMVQRLEKRQYLALMLRQIKLVLWVRQML